LAAASALHSCAPRIAPSWERYEQTEKPDPDR
jgi:hypothetical protein